MMTVLLFALALLVRLPGLFGPMWYDEIFSWWLQRLSPEQALAAIAGDVHPPLFYLTLFGTEPWQMRLGPLACSLAGLWVVLRLAHYHFPIGSKGPLWVGLIYALSPFEVFYATELRMYAALQLVMLLMLFNIVARRFWVAGAFGAVGVLLHHYGLIYLAGWGAVAWWLEIQRLRPLAGEDAPIWHWPFIAARTVAPLAAALLVIPFTGLLAQSQAVAANYWMWPPSPADVLLLPGEFLFSAPFGSAGLSALGIMGGVAALVLAARRPTALWPWLLAPVWVALVVSVLWRPIFQPRPLVAVAPLFYMALVAGLGTLSQRSKLWVAAVAAPLVVAVLLSPNTRAHYVARVNAPAVLQAIGPLAPGATIYHVALYTRVELEPFTPGVNHILYPLADVLGDGYTAQTRAALGIAEAQPEDLPQPPDVVIIYRGLIPHPAAESAARQLVADSAYHLAYTSADSERNAVWVFRREP